jgi:hypothetical protein
MVDVRCVALIAKIDGSAGASPSNRNNASFPKVEGEAPAEPTFSGTLFSEFLAA